MLPIRLQSLYSFCDTSNQLFFSLLELQRKCFRFGPLNSLSYCRNSTWPRVQVGTAYTNCGTNSSYTYCLLRRFHLFHDNFHLYQQLFLATPHMLIFSMYIIYGNKTSQPVEPNQENSSRFL